MKLQDLAQPKATKRIAKVFESYFGDYMAFDQLSAKQTRLMLQRIRGLILEHRSTKQRHFSEQNPAYLKLVMMEQALSGHLQEIAPPTPATPAAPNAQAKPAVDPAKLKLAQDKLAKGQKITPEEQTLVNAAAMTQQAQTESRLRRALRTLKESEVQQAQVVLAAQEMVDSMQGMIEDATEMQYKELPALVTSIRDQVGVDQSQQFNTDATQALTTLVQSLQTAKQQLETALGVVTGQAAPAGGMPGVGPDAGLPGAGPDAGIPGAEPGADLGSAMPPASDMPVEPEAPAGTTGALGRERR